MNPAPSTFAKHKAEAESVNAQRDVANARAQQAWQRIAELEACVRALVPNGWLKDDTMEHMPGIREARRLLGKKSAP